MTQTKKVASKQEKRLTPSKSGRAVAEALMKEFPQQAERIVAVMRNAATSTSMKRKLGRVTLAFESLRKAKP